MYTEHHVFRSCNSTVTLSQGTVIVFIKAKLFMFLIIWLKKQNSITVAPMHTLHTLQEDRRCSALGYNLYINPLFLLLPMFFTTLHTLSHHLYTLHVEKYYWYAWQLTFVNPHCSRVQSENLHPIHHYVTSTMQSIAST